MENRLFSIQLEISFEETIRRRSGRGVIRRIERFGDGIILIGTKIDERYSNFFIEA